MKFKIKRNLNHVAKKIKNQPHAKVRAMQP